MTLLISTVISTKGELRISTNGVRVNNIHITWPNLAAVNEYTSCYALRRHLAAKYLIMQ